MARLRGSTGALVAGAVVLALGTTVSIGALRAHADERREAQVQLATLATVAERHTARVWQSVVDGDAVGPAPTVARLRQEIDAALDRLATSDPAGHELLGLVRAYRDYEIATVGLLVALDGSGAAPQDAAVARLRTASGGLTDATEALQASYRAVASAATLAADAGTATMLVSAAVLLALLFRRSERARRAEAVLRREQEVLRASEDRFRALVHRSSDMTTVLDPTGIIRYQTPSSERLLGRPARDLVGATWHSLVHPDDTGRVAELLARSRDGREWAEPIEWRVRAEGGWITLETVASNLVDEPHVGGIVLNSRDVTERLELQRRLYDQAYHDALTRLPNRGRFLEELARAVVEARRDGTGVGVLLMDLDDFKRVNDSLGHPVGDELLVAVGERLRHAVRADDLVARLAGDEFAILVRGRAGAPDAVRVAERIVEALRQPFALGGQRIFIKASVGIVHADDRAEPSDLIRDADIAMYQAKAAHAMGYAVFEPSMQVAVAERLRLETDLRAAIGGPAISLAYQPIVALGDRRPLAIEALARWQHPEIGDVPPSRFIGLAEEAGLIGSLGTWVTETAIAQLAAWRRMPGLGDLAVHVNLSARQLVEDDLDERLAGMLHGHGIPPSALVLELTESAMADLPAPAIDVLAGLRRRGMRIAIDDFGTGSSTLGRLHQLPADVLKIDRLFTPSRGAAGQPAVVRAIVDVARALGLMSVAEGIEADDQATLLRDVGCDAGQGYLLGRPADAESVTAALSAALASIDAAARPEQAAPLTAPRPEPRPA